MRGTMDRLKELRSFLEPREPHPIVERGEAVEKEVALLRDSLERYRPETILKTGYFSEDIYEFLVAWCAENDAMLVLVDPDYDKVKDRMARDTGKGVTARIRYIVSDYYPLSLDYYAFDMVVALDVWPFLESPLLLEETKRVLQWEAHLVMSSLVLDDTDLDGVYDTFLRDHTIEYGDTYIASDFITIMKLKKMIPVSSSIERCRVNWHERGIAPSYFPEDLPETYRADAATGEIDEPLLLAVCMKEKPKAGETI